MAAVEVTISGVLYDKVNRTSQNVVLIGEATLTGLGVGGGPMPPGSGPPNVIWPSPGYPAHPIAPGGPPPGIWGGAPIPWPGHPIAPGGPPPGLWPPGSGIDMPSHPIVMPPPPEGPADDNGFVKPPPEDGGWAYHEDYGWMYAPPQDKGPKTA